MSIERASGFPFYDAAGIGRYVDECAVLEKMEQNPSFRDADFTNEELSFIRSCRFYYHTHTQAKVMILALERGIGRPMEFVSIEPRTLVTRNATEPGVKTKSLAELGQNISGVDEVAVFKTNRGTWVITDFVGLGVGGGTEINHNPTDEEIKEAFGPEVTIVRDYALVSTEALKALAQELAAGIEAEIKKRIGKLVRY